MKQGFTLIEIILALLVVSIGVVAAIGLLGTSLDTSAKARDDLHIVGFADLVLNHIHAMDEYSAIPTTGGNLTITNYAQEAVSIQTDNHAQFENRVIDAGDKIRSTFTLTYLLEIERSANTPDVKTISLQVWPGYATNGTPRIFHTEVYNWTDK